MGIILEFDSSVRQSIRLSHGDHLTEVFLSEEEKKTRWNRVVLPASDDIQELGAVLLLYLINGMVGLELPFVGFVSACGVVDNSRLSVWG
jgi:hypothetical protein